ncbi:50S ribosomal protein L21 [Salinibacter sp. 10B]|uniref:50S ribosomal protein L21 n=1 Tax=Salinibacter sp. 10B TaxID=1923971 RepID=UPI000CF4950B|nr:50S ribosomal protein L21 [Salinibacter sp. 10B]PQJ33977.1 50S ribosomal protein L21 [Salinibacter sp. 10B]
MYAIVDVKDKQFKVREDDTLYVPYHSDADVDQRLTLDRVLLLSNEDGDVTLGTPTVDDATVTARVVDHVKGDKVIVFKKKRRKRYRVKRGHRQQYTQIQIESLNADGEAPPPADDVGTDDEAETTSKDDATAADESTEEATDEPSADTDASSDDADAESSSSDEETSSSETDADPSDDADEEADADTDDASSDDDEDSPFDKETSF